MCEQGKTSTRYRMNVSITSKGIPAWDVTAETGSVMETQETLLDMVEFMEANYGKIDQVARVAREVTKWRE